MAVNIRASDDFNRANETPLASGNWSLFASAGSAPLNLASNAVTPSNVLQDVAHGWIGRTWAQDHSSKVAVTVTSTVAGSGIGPCVRFVRGDGTTTYSYYRAVVSKAVSNNVELHRFDVGVSTSLISYTLTHVDGDTYQLRASGLGASTVLELFHNDVSFAVFSDSAGLSVIGSPGVAYSSTVTSASADNWEGGEMDRELQLVGVGT